MSTKRLDLGAVSAYAMAVDQGYRGTEEEFGLILANAANYAAESKDAKTAAEAAAGESAGSAQAAEGYKTAAGKILEGVHTEGTTQIQAISTAGEEQIRVLEAKGTEQIQTIETAGAEQIEAAKAEIDEKGKQTLDSIPEDYTRLQTEVDELKGDLDSKINTPKNSDGTISNGISGQILQTNGDGTTQWVKPSGSTSTGGTIEETDPTVPDWAKKPQKPTYTALEVGALPVGTKIPSKTSDLQNDSGFLTEHQDLSDYALKSEVPKSASDVGADASGTAESKVSEHNISDTAHNDIRLLLQGLIERLNALADSDDTTLDQMSEVVAYIKSNKSLIDAITTSKVSVSDIIDNLTTNVANKPLSAAQGVKLKALIDAVVMPTKLSELENDSGYAKTTDIPDRLPNPQKLTFAGAVTAEYDGSGAVTVTIPKSSGGSGGTVRIEKLSTDTTVELEPNKLYIFPEMSELTITLAEPSDTGISNEYHFVFQSGATATTLTIPDTVKVPSGFSVDVNKIYEISILEGCLCAQSWAVS